MYRADGIVVVKKSIRRLVRRKRGDFFMKFQFEKIGDDYGIRLPQQLLDRLPEGTYAFEIQIENDSLVLIPVVTH